VHNLLSKLRQGKPANIMYIILKRNNYETKHYVISNKLEGKCCGVESLSSIQKKTSVIGRSPLLGGSVRGGFAVHNSIREISKFS